MKPKNLTVHFSIMQFCFWTCYAGICAFASFYLLYCGMTNTQIGIITAVSGALAALLLPVIGTEMDRHPALTSTRAVAGFFLLILTAAVLLIVFTGVSLPAVGVLFGFIIMTGQMALSLMNIIGVDTMAAGNTLNFNASRAIGSLGYAVASWFIGVLTVHFPPVVVPVTIIVFAAGVIALALFYPLHRAEGETGGTPAAKASSPGEFLKRSPAFLLLLPSLTMIFFGHSILTTFLLQIVTMLGGGSGEMGVAAAIAAVVEVFTLFGFSFLRRYLKIRTLLRISGVFFLLKSVLSAMVGGVGGLYGAQLCQMFAWGIMCVATVYFVNETFPAEDRAKGQTYVSATMTVANVLAAVIGGRIIDTVSIRFLLILGSIVSACGLALLFLATREKLAASRDGVQA